MLDHKVNFHLMHLVSQLNQSFFSKLQLYKVKILNGPFSNTILEIIERRKNFIKGTLGSLNVMINKKSNFYFKPTY